MTRASGERWREEGNVLSVVEVLVVGVVMVDVMIEGTLSML